MANKTTNTPKTTRERRIKPKVSIRKEIINIRAEINGIETKKTITSISETKSWFFEKINKIDKNNSQIHYLKKKGKRTQ